MTGVLTGDLSLEDYNAIRAYSSRFLTDDEESTKQPSSVRQCSRLLLVGVLGPIINKL